MTPSSELHQLILSLDKKEKAYFKMRSEASSDYVRLFDAIARQRVYDEEKIKLFFHGAPFLRRLPAVKNYLFQLILQSLALQYNDSTVEIRIQEQLRKVEFLLRKGLRKSAQKLLSRTRRLAMSNDSYLQALQAIALEKQIIRGSEAKVFDAVMHELKEAERTALERHQNLSAYFDLDSRIFQLRKMIIVQRSAKDLRPFREILRDPLLRHEKKALSLEARFYFHRINGICFQLLDEPERAMHHRKKLVELFDALPSPSEEQMLKHSSALYDLAVSLRTIHAVEEALHTVEQITALAHHYPLLMTEKNRSVLFKRATMIETDILQHFGLFDQGLARLPQLEKGLKRFASYIEADLLRVTRYNFALIYYGARQPRKALRCLNEIINENEQNFAEDVVGFAMLFRLLIHIDMGHDDLVESITRSTTHYLQKRQRLYKAETLFLDFAHQYRLVRTDAELRNVCTLMKTRFEALYRNPLEKRAEAYFDFISWFESRATGKKFADTYREKINAWQSAHERA